MPIAPSDSGFARKVLIAVGLICLTLLLLILFYFAFDVLLLVFAAALLAILLRGLADVLCKLVNIGEGVAVLIVSVLLLSILGGAVALLAPDVADQVGHLREQLPISAGKAAEYIGQFGWGRAVIDQLPSFDDVLNNLSASTLLAGVGGFFTSTVGAIGNFLIVILLSIYLAMEPRYYTRGFTNLFPVDKRTRVRQILVAIGDTLGWWLIGKVGSMLFIGLLTWIGLSILGVPLALTLGLIAGLLSFIPNFGPIMSAVPALLLGFIESPSKALYVLLLYIGVQLVESNLVTPMIERRTVEIPPALTIVFQLALAVMVGGLGLVLATPLLAVLIVLVQMVYVEDILGDRPHLVVDNKTIRKEAEELKQKEQKDAGEREELSL